MRNKNFKIKTRNTDKTNPIEGKSQAHKSDCDNFSKSVIKDTVCDVNVVGDKNTIGVKNAVDDRNIVDDNSVGNQTPLADNNNVTESTAPVFPQQAHDEYKKQTKKVSVINKLSAVWTIISTIYAIVTTCLFIAKGWVSHVASIVLVSILAVYVCVFIVLVALAVKDIKGGTKRVKLYKKTLKIFKTVASIVLLSLTAVSMVGMSVEGIDQIMKLLAFIITFIVAIVQLGLKIALLIVKLIQMKIAKNFKVEYYKFVDGRKKKKGVMLKLKERKYKEQ